MEAGGRAQEGSASRDRKQSLPIPHLAAADRRRDADIPSGQGRGGRGKQ